MRRHVTRYTLCMYINHISSHRDEHVSRQGSRLLPVGTLCLHTLPLNTRLVVRSTERQVSSENEKWGFVVWRELPDGVNKNELLIGPARRADFFEQHTGCFC